MRLGQLRGRLFAFKVQSERPWRTFKEKSKCITRKQSKQRPAD